MTEQASNSDSWLSPTAALNRPLNVQTDEQTAVVIQTQTIRRLGFLVGHLKLLIASQTTSELTDMVPICSIPNTASWLLGLINLRGNLVPVFDLKMLLQLESQAVKKRMLLILGQGEQAGAIIIDGLPTHIMLTAADKLESLPPLPAALKPFVPSGFEKQGDIWFNFDHLGFFQSLAHKVAV